MIQNKEIVDGNFGFTFFYFFLENGRIFIKKSRDWSVIACDLKKDGLIMRSRFFQIS